MRSLRLAGAQRFNNCMQLLSCICQVLAAIDDTFALAAMIIDLAAEIVYAVTQGCMQAQTHLELTLHPTPNDYQAQRAPVQSAVVGKVVN